MTNGLKKQDTIRVIQENPSAEILLSFQQSQIDFLFTQLIHRPWGYACWQPFVDVIESPDSYTIVMDVPGIDIGMVRVHLGDSKVTIEGHRDLEHKPPDRAHLCCSERPRGMFMRAIDIGRPVRSEITQHYEQGVLTVILQKRAADNGDVS